MKIICIVHFLYSFFNIVLEVFMKSKICLAKSRFGVSQCFAFVLSKENEPKVKDPFAEEFLPLAKPLENSASLCSCSRSFSSHILTSGFLRFLFLTFLRVCSKRLRYSWNSFGFVMNGLWEVCDNGDSSAAPLNDSLVLTRDSCLLSLGFWLLFLVKNQGDFSA